MAENNCTDNHENHVCVLAGKKKFNKIKEITQNPLFICYNCGRVSEFKENLCNPVLNVINSK